MPRRSQLATKELKSKQKCLDHCTTKERAFLLEWLIDYDNVRAVLAAGYKTTKVGAASMATGILKRPHIQALVKHFEKETQEEFEIKKHEILWHLCACATRNGKQFVDEHGRIIGSVMLKDGKVQEGMSINDLPDFIAAAIDGIKQKRKVYELDDGTVVEEIETELKLVSKAAALDMAMKHGGLFADNQGTLLLKVDESIFRRPPEDEIDPVRGQILEIEERSVLD